MYIVGRCDRSKVKESMLTELVLVRSVGRNDRTQPRGIAARCDLCVRGDTFTVCSHIITELTLIIAVQLGLIRCGDIGDGIKVWGKKACSTVPVQPMNTISLLTSDGALTNFTGMRPNLPALISMVFAYITRFQELASDKIAATIIELHKGVPILRLGGRSNSNSTMNVYQKLKDLDSSILQTRLESPKNPYFLTLISSVF